MRPSHLSLPLLGALFFIPQTSFALEQQDFITSLKQSGVVSTAKRVEQTGNTIVLNDVQFTMQNKQFVVPKITFKNISEDNSFYHIETVLLSPFSLQEGDKTSTIEGLTLDAFNLTKTQAKQNGTYYLPYKSLSIVSYKSTQNDKTELKAQNIKVNLNFDAATNQVDFFANVEKFSIKEEDAQFNQVLKDLDISDITGQAKANGKWNIKSGDIELQNAQIDYDKLFQVSLNAKIGGVIPQVQEQFKSNALPSDDLLGQMTVSAFTLSVSDNGLTNKALDMYADKQKTTRENVTKKIKQFLPLIKMQISHTGFTDELIAAVGTFLSAPQNLTITATPEKPKTFLEVKQASKDNPEKLIDLLNIHIQANK